MPSGYEVEPVNFINGSANFIDYKLADYRFLCVLVVIGGSFLGAVLAMLSGAFLKLIFTRCYLEYPRKTQSLWPEHPKHQYYYHYWTIPKTKTEQAELWLPKIPLQALNPLSNIRLTGVNKEPREIILSEIEKLRITDTLTCQQAKIPMFEEMLDVIKGREKLFLELKGITAATKMVDDLV